MRILLDTQCWLWMLIDPERLSSGGRAHVTAPENELLLSAGSAWEIAIKHALGRLRLPMEPAEYVPSRLAATGTMPLAIDHRHALRAGQLPPHHRDPFDRILIAQAQVEGIPILTSDPRFARYEVELLPA
ncbi:MAG: type II toxin-antitoxin system VapC family toxin [Candidatus Rokuibacteriota bacterium]